MTLDADGARARAASRAREGESVALRKCLLADGDALEAVFDAAARARARGVRVSGCLGRLRAPELARAIARGVRAGESGWLEELSAAETPALGELESELDVDALDETFRAIVEVRRVNVSKCALRDGALVALARALMDGDVAACESVNLRDNDAGEEACAALLRACERNAKVEEIVLTNNRRASAEIVENIGRKCRENWRAKRAAAAAAAWRDDSGALMSFRKLGLTNDDVDGCVIEAIRLCDGVAGLDLRDNAIGEVGMEALREVVESSPSLTSVNASGNPGFGTASFRRLAGRAAANFILNTPCDEALKSVSDRHLGDEGAEGVAEALRRKRQSARAIGVHHNGIGARGCAAIVDALRKTHDELRELAVYTNEVGVGGAEALATLVETHATLEVLDVGGNRIGDDGCAAIAEAIRRSVTTSRLIELHLDHNQITDVGAEVLLRAMVARREANNPMRTLWINGNDISATLNDRIMRCCTKAIDIDVDAVLDRAMHSDGSPPTVEELALAERDAARASERRDANSTRLANRIAARVGAEYKSRCRAHAMATRGTAVIAGIIMRDENATEPDDIVTLSLGVGTKFIPSEVAAAINGANDAVVWDAHVRDSHAEVLARRGFLRVLYRELNRLMDTGESPLLERRGANRATLRRGVTVHLYVSTAPCGAASAGPRGDVTYEWIERESSSHQMHDAPDMNELWFGPSHKGSEDDERASPPGCVLISRASDAIGVAGKSLSCSDKIVRWHALGLQGALLSHFLEPVRLASVVIGRKYDFARCTYATCCRGRTRGEAALPHPWMLYSSVKIECDGVDTASGGRELAGDGDESISWALGEGAASAHDGRTGTALGGTDAISICSRAVLWHYFLRLVRVVSERSALPVPIEITTYAAAKREASEYASERRKLYSLCSVES